MFSPSLAERLLRPIVVTRPIRLVNPNSWVTHIPFAFWLVEAMRPRVIVELGTQSGNSYAAFVQGVQALNLEAACYAVDTWQGDPQAGFYGEDVFTEWSAFHERHFANCSRLMRMTFDEARERFSDGSIDLLHIDGLHTLEAVRHDFERWRSALSARGVVLFHDINVREGEFGAWRFWEDVRATYPSFEFTHGHGLGVLAVGNDAADDVRWLTRLRGDDEGTALVRRFFHGLGDGFRLQLQAETLDAARDQSVRQLRDAEIRLGALEVDRDNLARALDSLRAEDESGRQKLAQQLESATEREEDLARARQQLAGAAEVQQRLIEQRELALKQLHDLQVMHVAAVRAGSAREKRLQARLADVEDEGRAISEQSRRRQLEAEAARVETAKRAVAFAAWIRPSHERASRFARGIERLRQAGLPPEQAWQHPLRFARGAVRLRHQEFRLQVAQLTESGLFDPGFYRRTAGLDETTNLVARFLLHGDAAGERPHPLFDPKWYVSRHGDAIGDHPPLLHYIRSGGRSPFSPHPLFDGRYYLEQWPADAALCPTPLSHFLAYGALGSASPHPLFDVPYYLGQHPRLPAPDANPLLHYLATAESERLDPHPLFSTSYYLHRNPGLGGENPLEHFVRVGAREGRSPHPLFDVEHYWQQRPDLRAAGLNPLVHYLDCGWKEGVNPNPQFETSYYLQQVERLGASGTNPLVQFVLHGMHEGLQTQPTPSAEELPCPTS